MHFRVRSELFANDFERNAGQAIESSRLNCPKSEVKMMRVKSLVIPTAIGLISMTGCVTRTTVKNEPRETIHFGSERAAQNFYEAYLANRYPSDKKNVVAVWIGLPYRHYTVSTDNVYFNQAVQSTDRNGDGVISEEEARDYVAKSPKHSSAKL